MKAMGKWNCAWLVLAGAWMLGSCGGNASKQDSVQASNDSSEVDIVQTRQVEEVRVTWLKDNAEDKLMPASLFALASDSLIKSLSLESGIPSSVSTFWVETNGIQVLFDAGNGGTAGHLLAGLDSIGVAPEDVKYVYLTHFHHDHIGGMLNGDSAVFANAEVYASKAEYDGWMAMDADKKAEVEKLAEAYKNRLHFFEFGDTLPGKVVALKAVGHTPGHTVYQAGKLLIIGDLIHGAALQLRHPEICASFDMNQEEAIQSRTQFLQYAKENGLTLAGMHLPAPAFMAPPFDF